MEPVGIWLLSIGLGDLIAGYSGEVAGGARGWWAWGVGSATTLAMALLSGLGPGTALALTAWSVLTLGLWLWARLPEAWSPKRASAILGGVAAAPSTVRTRPCDWLASLFMQASANALVRLLLAVVGTPEEDQSLRGGRFIGPMERTLIFGLGVAGYLTAAAVVATARDCCASPRSAKRTKGISTRRPNISSSGRSQAGSWPWPHSHSFEHNLSQKGREKGSSSGPGRRLQLV